MKVRITQKTWTIVGPCRFSELKECLDSFGYTYDIIFNYIAHYDSNTTSKCYYKIEAILHESGLYATSLIKQITELIKEYMEE